MKNDIVKRESKSSAYLDVFEDGTGRITFFNDENHWDGDIMLTKEQVDLYYSEY